MYEGYSLCLNRWALDKSIKNELGLLLIISSLCAENGYCYASNKYLAEVFDTNETLISRKLKRLERKKYITIEYEKRGNEVISREIRLSKTIIDGYRNRQPTVIENDKENIISNNIKKETNNINIISKERFKKPTLEEVQAYCSERNNNINAEKFINYYESKGWKVGNSPMKNWKACIRTWEIRNRQENKTEKDVPSWFNKDLGKGGFIDDDEDF